MSRTSPCLVHHDWSDPEHIPWSVRSELMSISHPPSLILSLTPAQELDSYGLIQGAGHLHLPPHHGIDQVGALNEFFEEAIGHLP